MDQKLYQQIVSEFRKSGSVDITAKNCGTYPIKVRKVLITEGLWRSKKSDAVNALRKRGYSVSEIAEELDMDEKNVQFYLPYTEGALSGEKTEGGKRVQSFRERSRNAVEGNMTREKKAEVWETASFGFSPVRMKESAALPFFPSLRNEVWRGYLLRAELVCNENGAEGDGEDIFEGEDNPVALRALLKTENGISRDLIVPGTMSLHQLSYALQKAFGFQNCHLHHYSFPQKLFDRLTENKSCFWTEMCGAYLHAPVYEDFEDLYWDDDYREGKSPNTWMKSKYSGEPKDYAVGETYIDTLRLLFEEREWVEKRLSSHGGRVSTVPSYDDLPLEEHHLKYYPEGNFNRVLERLQIQNIFRMSSLSVGETGIWRNNLQKTIRVLCGYLDACRETLSFQSLVEGLDTLRLLREDRQRLEHGIWLHRKEIRREIGGNPEMALEEIDRDILELQNQLGDAMHAFDPPVEPVTDTLYYNYDYGDDWLLKITCMEVYTRLEVIQNTGPDPEELFITVGEGLGYRDPELEKKMKDYVLQRDFSDEYEYEDTNGNPADDEIRAALVRAELNKEPVCIAAEGLSLVEDVGGVGGFFDFIQTIHGEDAEEAARMRAWARGLGWKEIRPKPETLL